MQRRVDHACAHAGLRARETRPLRQRLLQGGRRPRRRRRVSETRAAPTACPARRSTSQSTQRARAPRAALDAACQRPPRGGAGSPPGRVQTERGHLCPETIYEYGSKVAGT
eukprot:scaffold140153_cov60-Phaeocystis_antarctica.AAC.6